MMNKMKNQEQLGDQDVINEYFPQINTIPQSYNLMRRITNELIPSKLPIWDDNLNTYKVNIHANSDDAKILHYIINPKPFNINHPFNEKYSYLYTYYMTLIEEKKKQFYENKKKELK